MSREVFAPLAMRRSTFDWPVAESPAMAQPCDGDGTRTRYVVFNASAAAGLISSASDLGRFAQTLFAPRDSEARHIARTMIEAQRGSRPNPWSNAGWGLGLALEKLPSGETLAFHFGGNEGFAAVLAGLPERRVAIVVLSNSSNGLPFVSATARRWLQLNHAGEAGFCGSW